MPDSAVSAPPSLHMKRCKQARIDSTSTSLVEAIGAAVGAAVGAGGVVVQLGT